MRAGRPAQICLVVSTCLMAHANSALVVSDGKLQSCILGRDGKLLLCSRSKNSRTAVTTQPTPVGPATSSITTIMCTGGNWSSGLFDVCTDKKICVCGSLCSPCLECSLASHFGECFCFPLMLGSTLALRAGTRERYKIHGTLCEDWMVVHCCWPFAVCQMAREMKRRPTFQVYEAHVAPPLPGVKDVLV